MCFVFSLLNIGRSCAISIHQVILTVSLFWLKLSDGPCRVTLFVELTISLVWLKLIDANTHALSPLMNTSVGALKLNIVTAQLKTNASIKVTDTYLSAVSAMVVMDPYEAVALMRFNATVSLNEH